MALTVNKLKGGGATGQVTSEGIVVTYTVNYQVVSDAGEIGPKTAIDEVFSTQSITWLTTYSTAYESDGNAYMVGVGNPTHSADGQVWVVPIEYSNKLPFEPGQINPNPLLRPAIVRPATNIVRKTIRKDKDGNPIVTSAKLPFDPMPTDDVYLATFSITKNKAIPLDATWIDDIAGKTNSADYNGFSPDTLLCVDANSPGPQIENGIIFYPWEVSFTSGVKETTRIHSGGTSSNVDVPPFDLTVLDAGYKQEVSSNIESCKDDDGQDATEPMPLNADGTQLLPVVLADIGYKQHRVKDRFDFNALNLLP